MVSPVEGLIAKFLRPVQRADNDEIYRWTTDPRTSGLWRYRGGTPAPDHVFRQLWEGVTAQYCVVGPGSPRPLGLVGLYNSNHVSQYSYLFALSSPEALGTGAVTSGVFELTDYAFVRFRTRKIYIETVESSLQQFASAVRLGLLVEEGRLVDHEWNGHDYDDLVFLSVTPERWAKFKERISHGTFSRAARIP